VHAEGFGVEDTAARMGLSAALVRRLEKLHGEWLELTRLKLDSIPARCARDFLEAELRRRPGLTRAAVARRMGITQSELDRMVGYASTANSRPAAERRIGIAAASRLARALGCAPHELEGC
jgi:DNA-binding transcriptional regulator LsrR (DeoR family)